jgi:hypothetical protein
MGSRWARVARGWSAAAFAILVAAVSHTLAGGNAPSPFALAASLVIAGAVCTVFTGRRLSRLRLAASVALSQGLFHTVFAALGTPVTAQHHTGLMTMDAAAPAHDSATMWLGHAIAALVTVVVFAHAETAFWGLATTATLLVRRLYALVSAAPARTAAPAPPVVLVRESAALTRLLCAMRHRGPPALVRA